MSLYRKHILDHAKNPRFSGVLVPCDIEQEQHNPTCGDFLHLTLQLDDDKHLSAIAWTGEGCVISQASASILSEHVLNMSVTDVLGLGKDDVLSLLNIPLTPNRTKCAMLALDALHNGIALYLDEEDNP